MGYFKKFSRLAILSLVFVLAGCTADEDNSSVGLVVTDFQASYSEVTLKWELNLPGNAIVQDLTLYRTEMNSEGEYITPLMINLPSNETTYTDQDVPYKRFVTYRLAANYTVTGSQTGPEIAESEPQVFARDIVLFDVVPMQVQKDPANGQIFHILDKSGTGSIKRYDAGSNQVTATFSFSESWALTNRLAFFNGDVFIGDYYGEINRLNAIGYESVATYNPTVDGDMNAFTVDGDRVYYQDDQVLKFYNMSTGITSQTFNANTFSSMENLGDHQFLYLYAEFGGSSLSVKQILPANCIDGNCSMGQVADNYNIGPHSVDPFIFAWDNQKAHFVTSFNGVVFNLSTLQVQTRLHDITGKRYLNFAYDLDGNLYGSVQSEKIVHKFNSNYELVETIHTKLYPVYPILSPTGLSVLGSYEPINYWGYYYGGEFNFGMPSAIERF